MFIVDILYNKHKLYCIRGRKEKYIYFKQSLNIHSICKIMSLLLVAFGIMLCLWKTSFTKLLLKHGKVQQNKWYVCHLWLSICSKCIWVFLLSFALFTKILTFYEQKTIPVHCTNTSLAVICTERLYNTLLYYCRGAASHLRILFTSKRLYRDRQMIFQSSSEEFTFVWCHPYLFQKATLNYFRRLSCSFS